MAETDTLLAAMRARAASLRTLGYRVRLDMPDTGDSIFLDATGGGCELRLAAGEEEADTVLSLSSADLEKLVAGRLSPMLAFATGKLRVEGSRGVALKLASLLDED
ncbi:SCP2 sterol-binding domain-containing protein [Roseococcus sp. DSY-14]|uniref:SCP2 sterol-binding domain-containing protein n=1 Tax=Roseococcus sp. DSY-14 TaxID=3369650 RepID=UPI00387A8DE8